MVTTLLPAELALGDASPWEMEGDDDVVAGSGVCAMIASGKVMAKVVAIELTNHRSVNRQSATKGSMTATLLHFAIGCNSVCRDTAERARNRSVRGQIEMLAKSLLVRMGKLYRFYQRNETGGAEHTV